MLFVSTIRILLKGIEVDTVIVSLRSVDMLVSGAKWPQKLVDNLGMYLAELHLNFSQL